LYLHVLYGCKLPSINTNCFLLPKCEIYDSFDFLYCLLLSRIIFLLPLLLFSCCLLLPLILVLLPLLLSSLCHLLLSLIIFFCLCYTFSVSPPAFDHVSSSASATLSFLLSSPAFDHVSSVSVTLSSLLSPPAFDHVLFDSAIPLVRSDSAVFYSTCITDYFTSAFATILSRITISLPLLLFSLRSCSFSLCYSFL
jgi:hypothetical protein